MKGQKKTDVLPSSVKFEIFPSGSEISRLYTLNRVCNIVFNWAWRQRMGVWRRVLQPAYSRLKTASDSGDKAQVVEIKEEIKRLFKTHEAKLTFIGQNGPDGLTALLNRKKALRQFPRVPLEETLDAVSAAFKSFFKLVKRSYVTSERPNLRRQREFYKIPWRYKKDDCVKDERGVVRIGLGKNADSLEFAIPEKYCQPKLAEREKTTKLELYRDPRNMAEEATGFWVSVSYDIKKPEPTPMIADNTVFVAMGGSVAVVSCAKGGERVIHLSVPEKAARGVNVEENLRCVRRFQKQLACQLPGSFRHKQLVAILRDFDPRGLFRGIDLIDDKLSRMSKGSRRYKKLVAIRAKKFSQARNRGRDAVHKTTFARKPMSLNAVGKTIMRDAVHVVLTTVERIREGVANTEEIGSSGPLGSNNRRQSTDRIAQRVAALKRYVALKGGSFHQLPASKLNETERSQCRIHYKDSKSEIRRKRTLKKKFLVRHLQEDFQKM